MFNDMLRKIKYTIERGNYETVILIAFIY